MKNLFFQLKNWSSRPKSRFFDQKSRLFDRNTRFFNQNIGFFDRNTRFFKNMWQMASMDISFVQGSFSTITKHIDNGIWSTSYIWRFYGHGSTYAIIYSWVNIMNQKWDRVPGNFSVAQKSKNVFIMFLFSMKHAYLLTAKLLLTLIVISNFYMVWKSCCRWFLDVRRNFWCLIMTSNRLM